MGQHRRHLRQMDSDCDGARSGNSRTLAWTTLPLWCKQTAKHKVYKLFTFWSLQAGQI